MLEIRINGVVQVRNSDKVGNMGMGTVLVRPWGSQVPRICRVLCTKATDLESKIHHQ